VSNKNRRKTDKQLSYRPDITYKAPPVTGDPKLKIDVSDETVPSSASVKQNTALHQLYDDALRVDAMLNEVDQLIEESLSDWAVAIDSKERPSLADAARQLNDNNMPVIDFPVIKKAAAILNNAYIIQYGFDPSQLLFAEPDSKGHHIPALTLPDNMTCSDLAKMDISSYQSQHTDNPTTSIESLIDTRQRVTQMSLLSILWRMLLGFVYQMLAGLLRRSRLEKVPIAGRGVKRLRRKLERKAKELMNWVKSGKAFSAPNISEVVTDEDLNDIAGELLRDPQSAGVPCIAAAAQVIQHVAHYAMYPPTHAIDQARALNFFMLFARERSHHEATKVMLDTLHNGEDPSLREKQDQLEASTRRHPSMVNRYLNRSIQSIRRGTIS
jgi:hypothetical protein